MTEHSERAEVMGSMGYYLEVVELVDKSLEVEEVHRGHNQEVDSQEVLYIGIRLGLDSCQSVTIVIVD